MTRKIAYKVGSCGPRNRGDQVLYKCVPPMPGWGEQAWQYVVASAADVVFSGPETYLFGADSTGEIKDWSELHGSFQGGLDHDQAIRNAGYEVASEADVIEGEHAVAPLEIEGGDR